MRAPKSSVSDQASAADAPRTPSGARDRESGPEHDAGGQSEPDPEHDAAHGVRSSKRGHVAGAEPVGGVPVHAPSRTREEDATEPARDRAAACGPAPPRRAPRVLGEKAEVPSQVLLEHAAAVGRAADVDAFRTREEHHRPARLLEPVAPVRLLAEEEERLVEHADLVDRRPAHEQARTHQELRLANPVVVEALRVEGVQRARARGELPQEEVLGGEPPDGREAAYRPLQGAVRVEQPRADDRGAGARVGERHQPVERALREPRVGVEDEDVAALGGLDAPIPAGAEPEVLLLDQPDVRESARGRRRACRRRTRCRRRPWASRGGSPGTARSRAARHA